MAIIPRFPTEPLIEHDKLYDFVLRQEGIPWRGTGFPRGTWATQHESVLRLTSEGDIQFSDLSVWGLLFYGFGLEGELRHGKGMHLYGTLGRILASLRHAGSVILRTGYQGKLDVSVMLSDIRGKDLAHALEGFVAQKSISPLDDVIDISVPCDTEELKNDSDGVALRAMRMFFFAGDWPEIAMTEKSLLALLKDAYQYNGWGVPSA